MEQINENAEMSPELTKQLIRVLDNLTDAIREFSWILLDRWKWQPMEETTKQPTSMRSATD